MAQNTIIDKVATLEISLFRDNPFERVFPFPDDYIMPTAVDWELYYSADEDRLPSDQQPDISVSGQELMLSIDEPWKLPESCFHIIKFNGVVKWAGPVSITRSTVTLKSTSTNGVVIIYNEEGVPVEVPSSGDIVTLGFRNQTQALLTQTIDAKVGAEEAKQSVDQTKEQIDSIKSNIDTQQVDVNQKALQVAQNKASVDTTKGQIDTIKTAIDASQQDVSTKANQVSQDASSVASNKQAVDTTKGQIDSIKENIDTQQVDVNQKAVQVSQNKASIDTTKGQIDTIKVQIDTAQQDVTTKQGIASTAAQTATDQAAIALAKAAEALQSAINAAASALASVAAFKGAWQPNTLYAEGNQVTNGGNTYRAKAAFTSGSSFNASNWDIVAQGGGPSDKTVSEASLVDDLFAKTTALKVTDRGDFIIYDKGGTMWLIVHADTKTLEIADFKVKNQTTPLDLADITAKSINGYKLTNVPGYQYVEYNQAGWIYYARKDDGSEIKIDVPPAVKTFQAVQATTVNASGALTAGSVASTGPLTAGSVDTTGKINGLGITTIPGYRRILYNQGGWIMEAVKDDGSVLGVISRIYGYLASVVLKIVYGQSLSVGRNGIPVISTVAEDNILMLNGGVVRELVDSDPTRYDSLQPAVEGLVETACSGLARTIKQLAAADGFVINSTDRQYDQVIAAPGHGGMRVDQLSKGTTHYNRYKDCITAANTLSVNAGKGFNHPSLFYMQGEADIEQSTAPELYIALLKQLLYDINVDTKAITGQKNDVVCILYQTASINFYGLGHGIPLAQWKLASTKGSGFYGVVAMYDAQYADDLHLLNGEWYLRKGALAGYIDYQVTVLGKEWNAFQIVDTKIRGNRLEIKMAVHAPPLKLDTSWVTDPGNGGFNLYDSGGVDRTQSVSVIRPDTIQIVSTIPITTGFRLDYGINGTAGKSGRTQGSRGCLRDSLRDSFIYKPGTLNYAIDHPCPIFRLTL